MTDPPVEVHDETAVNGLEPDRGPRSLDPRVVTVWRIEAAIESAAALVVAAFVLGLLLRLGVSAPLAVLPLIAALLFGIVNCAVLPSRRWKSWQYAIDEAEIELRHGLWWQTWTRIPIARVQHVDTRRGPLERRYGLASLVVYTAAGARLIPGLAIEIAERSRDRIAALANVRDDV